MRQVKMVRCVVLYGEQKRTDMSVEISEELAGGIRRVVDRFDLAFTDVALETAGDQVAAMRSKLEPAGIIQSDDEVTSI